MTEVQQVPLSLIDPPLIPMREQFGDTPFGELEEDIGKNGITCPLVLRDLGDRKRVVYGHRRSEAAKACGLATVAAGVGGVGTGAESRNIGSGNNGGGVDSA